MQTLVTGVPGSGKTLYVVGKLLQPLIGQTVIEELDDGSTVEHPRRIYSNINGLQLDHELVEAGPAWSFRGGEWTQAEGHRLGFHNWHEWAPPGAVIVVDEFQKIWPPRPNGAPVPPDVQAMDTHRHGGVDFILISQKFSFDSHIMGLIGRHLHVRRIAGFFLAILYEWDHCSRSLQYSKAVAKWPMRYKRAWFKLYKSARVHTKQPRKTPTLVYVILVALAVAAWKIPESYSRIADKGVQHQARMAGLTGDGAPGVPGVPGGAAKAGPAAVVPRGASSAPVDPVAGCVQVGSQCRCFDKDANRLPVPVWACEERLPQGGPVRVVESVQELSRPAVSYAREQADGDVWASMRQLRR